MTKKNLKICFLALLVVAAMLMAACSSQEGAVSQAESSEVVEDITYTVTVKDAFGDPCYDGIAVQFIQNGERVAMQPCDENGVASKTLAAGEYEVSLAFSGGEDQYYYNGVTVNAEITSAEVILCNKITAEPQIVTVDTADIEMYSIGTGTTYVDLTPGTRNYFLFTPTIAGNYEFSLVGDTTSAIGYYGAPHYVMEDSAATVTENVFTVSIKASMIGSGDGGTSTLVIGVDSNSETSCVVGIRRIGDPIKTIEDEPWIVYQAETAPTQYQLPEGTELKEFDFTKNYTLVYNESDGFYHLDTANGPLVLMRLTEDSEYMVSYKTILDHTGVTKYFYNEDGSFDKKEKYSDCLFEYIACADAATGVYPLTKDLAYIVQQHGGYQGWWKPDSMAYLFVDMDGNPEPDINHDIAWLLMCCYAE